MTEYGYCVHDYTISPCEKYRDCVNCTEQVCIKGDDAKMNRIQERLTKSEHLLSLAEAAEETRDIGADRWYQYHKKTVARLQELLTILENPAIDDGTQIKLAGNDFSQFRRVAEKKSIELVENKNSEDASNFAGLVAMLGDRFGKAPEQ